MVEDTYVRPAAFQAATIIAVFVVVRSVGFRKRSLMGRWDGAAGRDAITE